jgi:HAD superfamily hydrolase (TIGR01549 family)
MQYLIFDVDGTLINSEQMYWQALSNVLTKYNYSIKFSQFHETFGKTMEDALRILEVDKNALNIMNEWKSLLPIYNSSINLFPGIIDMLHELFRSQNVMTCIATSETMTEFKNNIVPLKLDKYFDAYTLSSEVRRGKPFPDIITCSLGKLRNIKEQEKDLKDKYVYIGDAYSDLLAAKAAGISFGLAGWSVKQAERKVFQDADYFFEEPNDVLKI